jgi:hypothetical protein
VVEGVGPRSVQPVSFGGQLQQISPLDARLAVPYRERERRDEGLAPTGTASLAGFGRVR